MCAVIVSTGCVEALSFHHFPKELVSSLMHPALMASDTIGLPFHRPRLSLRSTYGRQGAVGRIRYDLLGCSYTVLRYLAYARAP